MLDSNKNGIIITIGEYGIIFAAFKNGKTINKIFVKDLGDDTRKKLGEIFDKNSSLNVYILLDTIEQTYKKKEYPFVKESDLKHLIQRDLMKDSVKSNIKNHIILKNSHDKGKISRNKKWHCLFAFASISKITQDCIDFVKETPNRLIGIYMSPIESCAILKSLKSDIRFSSKIKDKKSDIYCLITQTKVSRMRQTIFFENQMVFTRLLDYDSRDSAFLEKYEKDLMATWEYLKRLFPEIDPSDFEAVNILPEDALKKISEVKSSDFNFVNYTPYKASLISTKNSPLSQNSPHCDLLISKSFCESPKKILKFATSRIKLLEKLFLAMRISYFTNLFLLLLISSYCLLAISDIKDYEDKFSTLNRQSIDASKKYNRVKNKALDGDLILDKKLGEVISFEKILDLGKIHETLSGYDNLLFESYDKFRFLKNHPTNFDTVDFNLENKSDKNLSNVTGYEIKLSGKITNKSGNIEDLFSEFDATSSSFKKEFVGDKISYNELPKNIDFTKQYFEFPIEFSIKRKIKKTR